MRTHQIEQLWQLIDTVYDAATDEDHWARIAPQIARTFGSTSATLQIQRAGASSHILSMTENVRSRIDAYQDYFWQRDIWVERATQRVGLSKVGSSADMVGDGEFEETEFYRDWCRHLDVFYVVGAVFPSGDGSLGVLGIHRPRSAGAYGDDDKYQVSRFLPHLQRALRIREQLGRCAVDRKLSRDVLFQSGAAVLLVTADGSIRFASRQAERILADAVDLCSHKGRLMATDPTDNERLRVLIREASRAPPAAQSAGGLMAIRRPTRAALNLLVSPFRGCGAADPSAGAIVLVRDPTQRLSVEGSLRALFQFTPTEARIAQALINGRTLPQIAALHGATLQTVRKQLKNVLAKTGTRRQVECVALMLRSIGTFACDPC